MTEDNTLITLKESVDARIQAVVDDIWYSFLFEYVEDLPEPDPDQTYIASVIEYLEGWEGFVTIECTQKLGLFIASKMFSMPEEDVERADIHDCLGEVANIIGGNIKFLLPEKSHQGTPVVITNLGERISIDTNEMVTEIYFSSQGEPFVVRLYKGLL